MPASPDNLRDQWMAHGLSHNELNPDPIHQFELWFTQAVDSGIPEPNAMTLATADAGGQPSARTVLLKLYDARGFVFFTNYESEKARQIRDNPRVALLFPWVALGRQVKIGGTAEKIPATESRRYFTSRPRGSQIGAWASPQSQVISSRSLLDAKVDEMKRRLPAARCRCRHSGVVTGSCRTASNSGRHVKTGCMTGSCTPGRTTDHGRSNGAPREPPPQPYRVRRNGVSQPPACRAQTPAISAVRRTGFATALFRIMIIGSSTDTRFTRTSVYAA